MGDLLNPNTRVPVYCAQQITIPPALPDLLKQFTKAAIRTQPENVIAWAAEYFEALARGEAPPQELRVRDNIPTQTAGPLTVGHLRSLKATLEGGPAQVSKAALLATCESLGFPQQAVNDALGVGDFGDTLSWVQFVALEAADLAPKLTDTLGLLAQVFSAEGTAAGGIPFGVFETAYRFLAKIDGDISEDTVKGVLAGLAGRAVVRVADLDGATPAEAEVAEAPAEATPAVQEVTEGDAPAEAIEVQGEHVDAEAAEGVVAEAAQGGEETFADDNTPADEPVVGEADGIVVEGHHVEPQPGAEGEAAAQEEATEEGAGDA